MWNWAFETEFTIDFMTHKLPQNRHWYHCCILWITSVIELFWWCFCPSFGRYGMDQPFIFFGQCSAIFWPFLGLVTFFTPWCFFHRYFLYNWIKNFSSKWLITKIPHSLMTKMLNGRPILTPLPQKLQNPIPLASKQKWFTTLLQSLVVWYFFSPLLAPSFLW